MKDKSKTKQKHEYYRGIKEGKQCLDCKQYFDRRQLQFDHIKEKGDKIGCVANMINTHPLNEVQNEIAKCELVCGNCHTKRTAKRRNLEVSFNEYGTAHVSVSFTTKLIIPDN
jgi:5-methylcytosine-specific restriction endonuclease McrA